MHFRKEMHRHAAMVFIVLQSIICSSGILDISVGLKLFPLFDHEFSLYKCCRGSTVDSELVPGHGKKQVTAGGIVLPADYCLWSIPARRLVHLGNPWEKNVGSTWTLGHGARQHEGN